MIVFTKNVRSSRITSYHVEAEENILVSSCLSRQGASNDVLDDLMLCQLLTRAPMGG